MDKRVSRVDQTQDKLAIAERIRKALEEFVEPDEKKAIVVFESSAGNLRAVVGSRKFLPMSPVQRQQSVWKFLHDKVDPTDLVRLYGVHTLDPREFAEDQFRKTSSTAVSTFFYPDNQRPSEN